MIEEVDEAELAARGAGSGLTGRLRICGAVTFARIHLMPHLPEFLARHPELEMEVVLDDRNIDLVQEGIDVALRMGQLSDSSLTARRIASGRYVVVGTPAYFEQTGEPTAPGDLAAHRERVGLLVRCRRSPRHGTNPLRKALAVLVKLTAIKHSTRERGIAAELIKTNNTQNTLRAPDFRSNDKIQQWLENQFKKV